MSKTSKSLKILFIACEVAPFAKTGGLADVAGSLPLELGALGVDVLVVTPKYRGIEEKSRKLSSRVSIRFIENDAYFNREGIYGDAKGDYKDNLERFAYFCRRSLEFAKESGFRPDIVHCHEWHTGLIPIDLKTLLRNDPFFAKSRTLFTIHNLAYQGLFPLADLGALGVPDPVLASKGIEFWGRGNLMKGGLLYADMLSTVSKTYAKEICTPHFGCGLDDILRRRKSRLTGILNGLDTKSWDPQHDPRIKHHYSAANISPKDDNKRDLEKICGFEANGRPIFGMVTRLVEQKGLDLVAKCFDAMMETGLRFVLVGTGEEKYHKMFEKLGAKYAGQAFINLKFDEPMARKVYAGSDFFLMPSRFEPCGLGQLISFRYGTLPVASRTGGLGDTVIDCTRIPLKGNGILFSSFDAGGFMDAVKRALSLYRNQSRFKRIRKRAMKLDFSWKKSAKEYVALYEKILKLAPDAAAPTGAALVGAGR